MTVGRARSILSLTWVIFSLPLFGLVFLQTISRRYPEWETGFTWLIPLLFPILSFIIATWTVAKSSRDRIVLQNGYVFYSSVVLSIVYLASLYFIAALVPREIDQIKIYVVEVMHPSSWYLGTFQAIVVVAVGKFFLEEINEEPSERDKTQPSERIQQ